MNNAKEICFNTQFQIKSGNSFVEGLKYPFSYLPRQNDVVLIDGTYFEILLVEYAYKEQETNVTIYADSLGNYAEYQAKLIMRFSGSKL